MIRDDGIDLDGFRAQWLTELQQKKTCIDMINSGTSAPSVTIFRRTY